MIDIVDIKIAARGSELQFLKSLGLTDQNLSGKHQPCPGCGGKDRYRAKPDGTFFCGGGGDLQSGDWIDNACHCLGMNIKDVLDSASEFYGLKNLSDEEKESKKKYRKKLLADAAARSARKDKIAKLDSDISFLSDDLRFISIQGGPEREISMDEVNIARELYKSLISLYKNDG